MYNNSLNNKKLFKVDEKQFNKYRAEMQQWINNEGLDITDVKQFVKDYDEIKLIIDEYAIKYNNDVEHIYVELEKVAGVSMQQTLADVKAWGFWDIDYKSLTITINIDNGIILSNYFNGFDTKCSDPWEDIEIDVARSFIGV